MSTPHLGEFFAALLGCAIERCERGDPASLRYEIGRLAYLTFGYSERDWLDQALFESDLNDETQGVLLAQLDRELCQSSPSWLDRIQLRALILGVIRLVRAQWFTREELLREVCHIFSLSTEQLATTDLSNVATLAPHLWIMLNSRAQLRRRSPKISPEWAPIPNEYTALSVMSYQEDYWLLLVRRAGLTAYLELARTKNEANAHQLKASLSENVSGWLETTRCGQEDTWVWAEHPAHLDLSLLTRMEQALTPEQSVLVCLPILRALSALHRTHRVCGTLTPDSILIDSGCQAMLGKRLAWYPHVYESQVENLRTKDLSYWSPERFLNAALPTPQSDMWAFGLILYQLLCGDLPWQNQSKVPELIRYIKKFDHAEALKRVPESLRSFLARCLTPDLDHRWSHATQALEALSDVAELTSPLLKGQRLSEQWTVLMEVDGPQRFIEETAIIPTYEPEEDLARFIQVRIDLDDLASPHIDALTLKPLFPKLKNLHERWWSNHAITQETQNQQSSSLESFRLSLSNIAPEFLFEQLTLLSQQKESLELRFQDRMKRLVRERAMIREEVRQHTKETLLSLWQELGLPEDLIPNLSLEAAANRGAKRTALANAPRTKPQALLVPPQAHEESVESRAQQAISSPQHLNKTAMEFAVGEPENILPTEELSSSEDNQGLSLSPQELSVAEAVLREEIFSTPPMERLEKLSELGALKREIELSQPISAVSPPPPEWSSPPHWDAPPAVVSLAPIEDHQLTLSESSSLDKPLEEESPSAELDLAQMPNISEESSGLQDNLDLDIEFDNDIEENMGEDSAHLTLPGPAELHHTADSQPLELNLSDGEFNTFDDIDEAEVDHLIDELHLELTSSAPVAGPVNLSDETDSVTDVVEAISSSNWEPMIIDDFDFESQFQSTSSESSASSIEDIEELDDFDELEEMEEPISQTLSMMMSPNDSHELSQPQVTPPPLPDQIFRVKDELHHEISSAISLLNAELSSEHSKAETVETEALNQTELHNKSEGDA